MADDDKKTGSAEPDPAIPDPPPPPDPPPHDGWQAHVEHGVAELKKRGLTKAKIRDIVESAFDAAP